MQKILIEQELEIKKFADKLAVLYELFNWVWSDGKVPNSKQIEENIYYLIKRAIEIREENGKDWSTVGTGGLNVRIDKDDLDITWSKEEALYLQFTNKLIQ